MEVPAAAAVPSALAGLAAAALGTGTAAAEEGKGGQTARDGGAAAAPGEDQVSGGGAVGGRGAPGAVLTPPHLPGSVRYEDPALEVQLSDELAESLRTLKV